MKTRLIGVTGYAQHGKDTVGRVAVATQKFHRYAFADQLKLLALETDPIIDMQYREPPANEVYDMRLSKIVDTVGWEAAKGFPEVRRILQELGTGARNVIGKDVWVDALAHRLVVEGRMTESGRMLDGVVVTDVRFPNEAKWIHDHDGVVVLVLRPDFDNGVGTTHVSESHIMELPVDHVFLNDHDLADFEYKVWRAIDQGTLTRV